MVFEGGCAVAKGQGQKGSRKGTGRRELACQDALWCFFAAVILAGVVFGYNWVFEPGHTLMNKAKEGNAGGDGVSRVQGAQGKKSVKNW